MKHMVTFAFVLMLCWTLVGCSESPDTGQNKATVQAGEYYSFVTVEGDFKVLKVLVVNEDVVHFCYYNNVFKERPSEDAIASLFFGKEKYNMTVDFSDGQQTTGSKHAALALEGWVYLQAEVFSKGEVTSDELIAFEKWQNDDNYVLPSGTKICN